MYAVMHPDLIIQPWHTYVAFLLLTVLGGLFCIFCNHLIPKLQNFGLFLVVGGGIITIICLAAMPETHASTSSVFVDWSNLTGWGSVSNSSTKSVPNLYAKSFQMFEMSLITDLLFLWFFDTNLDFDIGYSFFHRMSQWRVYYWNTWLVTMKLSYNKSKCMI
jgi:hypothetical protein